jgi:class 3 adenylate cyclase
MNPKDAAGGDLGDSSESGIEKGELDMNSIIHLISCMAQYRSPNPYLNRVMIRNIHGFYGRKRELTRLYARIGADRPQSVSITGERRIGKSSLLWFLMQPENVVQRLSDPDSAIFIFLDFQENRDMQVDDFCATVLAPLSKRVPDIHPDGGYDAFLSAVQHLDESGHKLIMLMDEFETITQNPSFDERFYDFLRALANRYNVAYITSSRRPLQYLCHSKQIAGSPFFNIFSSLHLRGFTEAEALELITIPSRAAGTPLEDHADFLMDLGGTYPFFLQIACSALLEYLQMEGELDDMGREEVCENILEDVEDHFSYIWSRMEENEQRVCGLIVSDEPIERRDGSTLRNLVQQGYVLEGREREAKGYRIFSSLFAEWIENADLEIASAGGEYVPEAIVVIDICGSTTIASRYGAHRLSSFYDQLEGIAFEVASRFRDRYRRTTGDGVLLTFNTVTDAVNACLEIRRRVHEHNVAVDKAHRIPIRFSIHFGETLVDAEGRRHGTAVNKTFRVESLGSEKLSSVVPEQNYLLVTEEVARELVSVQDIKCCELGTFELDGLTGLHRIYLLKASND